MPKEPVEIRNSCQHFGGEFPCVYHKREKLLCPCEHFSPFKQRILILKLGAMGDVLRTTPLLKVLSRLYPQAQISWLVNPEGVVILEGNPELSRILPFDFKSALILSREKFELLYSLEVELSACALAGGLSAGRKFGFGLNEMGRIYAFNPGAENYLEMSFSDLAKKQNQNTYLELLGEITELGGELKNFRPYLKLGEKEKIKAQVFAKKCGLLKPGSPVIGLNLGGANRWATKAWLKKHFISLIKLIKPKLGFPVLLYAGPEEAGLALQVCRATQGLAFFTGSDNTVAEFFALLALSTLLVTSDSLALHAGLALGKKVIGLFGATSYNEIDEFGQLTKIIAPVDCTVCYRRKCDKKPFCMELIRPQEVLAALQATLKIVKVNSK